ncbi:MAG: FecR domain-containing protein [Steroidobacteraceae bacterium]
MNVEQPRSEAHGSNSADEKGLAVLLQKAGRRPEPPADLAERIYQHTHEVWRARVRRRTRYRWLMSIAAGIVIVVVGWGALFHETPASAVQIATIESIVNGASIESAGSRQTAVSGNVLLAGDVVETGVSDGITIQRLDGLEVRIGAQSRVVWNDAAGLSLTRGRVYVDSGSRVGEDRALLITIPAGVVQHLGTRYQVDVQGQVATVAVREGRVLIKPTVGTSAELSAGQAAHVNLGAGIERLGASRLIEWTWADALGRSITIDNRSLSSVLEELARAESMQVLYADPVAAQKARDVQLHGKDLQLSPRDAMQAIVATTGMTGKIEDDRIVVSLPDR